MLGGLVVVGSPSVGRFWRALLLVCSLYMSLVKLLGPTGGCSIITITSGRGAHQVCLSFTDGQTWMDCLWIIEYQILETEYRILKTEYEFEY